MAEVIATELIKSFLRSWPMKREASRSVSGNSFRVEEIGEDFVKDPKAAYRCFSKGSN